MTLCVDGSRITGNHSNGEGGRAGFFVSNDRSGSVETERSVLRNNAGRRLRDVPRHLRSGDSIIFSGSVVE